jgi:hypothetical protein
VSRAPLPNSGVTSVGETCTVSWEGITPPSSLVLAHSPLPLGSLLLRFWPRSESPCRLSPIPAAHGSFPTLFRESVLGCWTPCPGGTPCARACFFHGVIGLPHGRKGSASRVYPANDFSQGMFSRLQVFRNVPASKFARPPDRSYRCDFRRRAAGAFTSGPLVLCCRRTPRIC